MAPGDLIRRNRYQTSGVTIFREIISQDFNWIAVVLKVTPPPYSTTHYTTIEALVTPDNLVMKTYLLAEEMENLVEVLK
jgi:hypothetical protein